MKDGLYRVVYRGVCAGFIVKNGCAHEWRQGG
jgi:hypothetical protein